MGTKTVDQTTSSAALPFETDTDLGWIPFGQDRKHEPALLINPNASLLTLLSVIMGRAHALRENVTAWACVDHVDVGGTKELASSLLPATQEITILIHAATAMLAAEARHD